jgi:glycosyltransferase involved in cell wall biosynthesis
LQNRYPCKNGHTASCSNVEIPKPNDEILVQRLKKIDSSQAPYRLGLIGSLNSRTKGVGVAFRALSRVLKSNPYIYLDILGDGPREFWTKEAKKLGLSNNVTFSGVKTSGEAVFKWLDQIDLYLQPSFQEGLPRATIEAMSRGCPVLGSTAGGIPELIDKECLHSPGDDALLARQIANAIGNKEWLKQQAKRNFNKSLDYTNEKLDQERNKFWHEFYEYVIKVNNA